MALRGLAPATQTRIGRSARKVVWSGPAAHCLCYPVADAAVTNVVACVDYSTQATTTTVSARSEQLIEAFSTWDPELVTLLDTITDASLWPLYDRDPLPRWGTQRTTLIGDAAHPMLPFLAQGANQAIEDSVVLAGCLSNATDAALPEALRRYEQLRSPRTARVQLGSRSRPPSRESGSAPALPEVQRLAWIYGHRAEASDVSPTVAP